MKPGPGKIIEITWLVVAVLSLFAGMHKTLAKGFTHSYQFFLIVLVALLMYFNRRNNRTSR